MALRVLLADENVTIKKVIQLSLQDYAVTVKSVNLGVDVLDIARSFKPDIIFADVLLQKRNGYDVCSDFKNDPELAAVPFILIWSGFMELDQNRFQTCGADGELEKPFDKETLRKIIADKVTKTSSNQLSQHIELPPLPDQEVTPPSKTNSTHLSSEEGVEQIKPLSAPDETEGPSTEQSSSHWDMDSFEDIENFVQKPLSEISKKSPSNDLPPDDENLGPDLLSLPKDSSEAAPVSSEHEQEEWVQSHPQNPAVFSQKSHLKEGDTSGLKNTNDDWSSQDLSKFKLNIDDTHREDENFSEDVSIDYNAGENVTDIQESTQDEQNNSLEQDNITEDIPEFIQPIPSLNEKQLEKILKSQSKDVIESVVWKVVPDLAERIIREKLDQLMKDLDRI